MGRITASRKQLDAGSAVRVDPGQQVHQLPDARRQEERRAGACSTTRWTSSRSKHPGRRADRGLHAGGRERQAGDRSPLEARRRCRLSGADAGQPQAAAVAGDSLDPDGRPREEGPADAREAGRRVGGRLQARRRGHDHAAKTSTAWPTPTRRSPTSPGKLIALTYPVARCATGVIRSRRCHARALGKNTSRRSSADLRIVDDARSAGSRFSPWHASSNNSATSASSPTSTPARPPSPSGCSIYSGARHRVGEVDKGTTVTDFDPEEQQRGITIYAACVTFPWKDVHGQPDRHAGPRRFHGRGRAQPARARRRRRRVQRPRGRRGAERNRLAAGRQVRVPRLAFINKMDREGADFDGTFDEIRERLEANPVAIQIPVGAGPPHVPDAFRGVIDLVEMQMLTFDDGKPGAEVSRQRDSRRPARRGRAVARARCSSSCSTLSNELAELVLAEERRAGRS